MSTATILSVVPKEAAQGKTDPANEPTKPTRKEKQAARNTARKKEEREKILWQASLVKKPTSDEDRLLLVMAEKIRVEDGINQLEEERKKIEDLLGGHSDQDSFAADFAVTFSAHSYRCPIKTCGSESGEKVKWILPLKRSIAKASNKAGEKDCEMIGLNNHSAQWKLAVKLFQKPDDLQGIVLCEDCKPGVEKALEEKSPQDHPGNHRLYHIDGFIRQLGRNRYDLLKKDLDDIEMAILEKIDKLQAQNRRIGELQERIDETKARTAAINDFLS